MSTVFKGVAGVKELNSSVEKTFTVLTNKYFLNSKVKLDSNDFEKYFDVISVDKIYAVSFLTADIMEKIVNLYEKYNCRFEFALISKKMFFRIFSDFNFFELPNVKKGIDEEYFKKHCDILIQIKNITESIAKIVDNN